MAKSLNDYLWTLSPEDLNREKKYILDSITKLGKEKIEKLIKVALKERKFAYTPYSHYNVGAAILAYDNKIFGGCNSESVAYSPTNHAEGSAISKANTEGLAKKKRRYIKAVAVVHEGDSGPCGECLQRIVEHADNCLIIIASPKGSVRRITSLLSIFPYNFNPSHLGK